MYHYPKQFLSVTQLLQKLIDAGMTIGNRVEAERALSTIGYYRLKGYCFHWYDHTTNKYQAGTDFSKVLSLYHFDAELSHLLFGYLSKIEVALRARLVNAFQSSQDALVLNDPSVFDEKEKYWKNQSSIASEIARSNDVFIQHNFDNHDGAIPLWATVEVMTFGTLSKVIKTLNTGNQSAYNILAQHYKFQSTNGNYVTPSKKMLSSWIQAVSNMRNVCAHNSRIYNRAVAIRPQLISSDIITPAPQYNGLYQLMLTMKYLRPTDSSWTDFVTEFNALLGRYAGVYDLHRMNFPIDWVAHFTI